MTDLIPGAVTIADLYRELVGMRSDLTRVLAHQEATDLINHGADQIHADHEARLRVIEATSPTQRGQDIEALRADVGSLQKFRYMLAGGLALLSILLSLGGYWLGSMAHH